MRRVIVFLTLALLSTFAIGLAPLAPAVHAQTTGPTVTVTPNPVAAGGTATVQGTGFTPNNYVFAYWQRPDGTTNGIYVFTDPTGSFAFTLGFDPSHGTGYEYVSAYDYATARWAPFVTVQVVSSAPPPTVEHLSAAPNPVVVGGTSTISGTGFTPNDYVYVQWQRPNGTINATYVFTDYTGAFSFQLGFLQSNGCGSETIQAYDYGTGTWSGSYVVTVTGC